MSALSSEADQIEKAVKFWKHASLQNVPSKEKLDYLKSRGLTDDQIHQVWEKLIMEGEGDSAVRPAPPPLADDVVSHRAALLAVGSVLGLTAAAAVRWLNGGDFTLFPPPHHSEPSSLVAEREESDEGHLHGEHEDLHNSDNGSKGVLSIEYSGGGHCEDEARLAEQMNEILDILKNQSEQQDRLFQQLTAQQTKQVTDQSMAVLRGGSLVLPQDQQQQRQQEVLAEVKSLLEKLPTNEIVDQAIEKLSLCLVNRDEVRSQQSAFLDLQGTHGDKTDYAVNRCYRSKKSPKSSDGSLRQVVQRLVLENEPEKLQAGSQVLYLYVLHLSSNPHVPRYRKINTTNESFRKVRQLKGGIDLLKSVGFMETEGNLEWQPETEEDALAMLQEASAALSVLKSSNPLTEMNTRESLCGAALATLRPSPTPPPPTESEDWKTPQNLSINRLVSPPNTKKHPFVPTPKSYSDSPESMSILNEMSQEQDSVLNLSSAEDHRILFDPISSPTVFQPVLWKLERRMVGNKDESSQDEDLAITVVNDIDERSREE